MPRAILFDLNGTLLDLQVVKPDLNRLFGSSLSLTEWFQEVLHYSLVLTVTGEYREFSQIINAVLEMKLTALGIEANPQALESIQQRLTALPPFEDVIPALTRLKELGFRLATLTNSSAASQAKQLAHAGLRDLFEQTFSVDQVSRFKPAPEPYLSAVSALGLTAADVLLVAAHGWDTYGAHRAGLRTAFVQRPGQALFPLAPAPDFVVRDLAELA